MGSYQMEIKSRVNLNLGKVGQLKASAYSHTHNEFVARQCSEFAYMRFQQGTANHILIRWNCAKLSTPREREREKKIIIVTRKIGSGNGRSYGKLINGIDVRCELMVIAELEYIKPAALFPYFRHLFSLSLSLLSCNNLA